MSTQNAAYKISDDGLSITCPEDGTFTAQGPQGQAQKTKVTFAAFIAETIAGDGRFAADLYARRLGHEIRDAFAGKKAGEDSAPLSLAAAHALWSAVEKPTGGYSALAAQMPTSWLYAIPAADELPELPASRASAAARPPCAGCGQPDDGHTHCDKCGGNSGVAPGKPGGCQCNAAPEPAPALARCLTCGRLHASPSPCAPEALAAADAIRAAAKADEAARHEAAAAEAAQKDPPP